MKKMDYSFSSIGLKKPCYSQNALPQNVPHETLGTITFGLMVHVAPAVLFIAIVSFCNFSLPGLGIAFISMSIYTLLLINWAEKKYPCVTLEPISKLDLFKGLSLVFITAAGVGSAFIAGGIWILSSVVTTTWQYGDWSSVFAALFLTDFAYYWIHRSLNHSKNKNFVSKWYRKIHGRHHIAKPLDFFRGNVSTFFDTAITSFQLPLILIAVMLGMKLETVLTTYFLLLTLQSTHHANHTFNIGILRYFFVDNHSHKLHHCPRGYDINFGAVFSIWDILFKTYYEEWNLSASYMAKHHVPLPIRKKVIL